MTMPTQLLPRPLWMASRAIPLAYGIKAARRLLEGAPWSGTVPAILGLGWVYALLGWYGLRRAIRRMRVLGTTKEF